MGNGFAFAEVLTPSLSPNHTMQTLRALRNSSVSSALLCGALVLLCCGVCAAAASTVLQKQRQLQTALYMEQEQDQPLIRRHRLRTWHEWRQRAILARFFGQHTFEQPPRGMSGYMPLQGGV
jgi:hypothetical protein